MQTDSTTKTPQSAQANDDQSFAIVHRSYTQRKGFAQIPNTVLLDPSLSDAAVRLYGVLLSYAMQAEALKVGQKKMAADSGKDARTIRRLLKELHTRGLITPERQGQRTVNVYVIEDAYALYDSERPEPKKRVRTAVKLDKNVPSAERTKTPSHVGQKSPLAEDKNVRLLNTPENKEENKKEILPSVSEDKDSEQKEPAAPGWGSLTQQEQQPHRDKAAAELAAIHAGRPVRPRLVEVRARNLYEAEAREKRTT